jgi:hypothetical protein
LCSLNQHLCFLAHNHTSYLIPHPRSVENWRSHYSTLRSSSEVLRTPNHHDVIHRQVAVCVVAVEVVVNLDRSADAVSPTWLLPSQHQSSFPDFYWVRSTHVTIPHIQKERQAASSHQPFPSSAVVQVGRCDDERLNVQVDKQARTRLSSTSFTQHFSLSSRILSFSHSKITVHHGSAVTSLPTSVYSIAPFNRLSFNCMHLQLTDLISS